MNDIETIYHNSFGIAFYWKKETVPDTKKIQIIFRDTGLLISMRELQEFSRHILRAKREGIGCKNCPQNESCRSWLVDTPASQITLAMNIKELNAVQDLVKGTLFQLSLSTILEQILE